MFDHLTESQRRRTRQGPQIVAALTVHAILTAGILGSESHTAAPADPVETALVIEAPRAPVDHPRTDQPMKPGATPAAPQSSDVAELTTPLSGLSLPPVLPAGPQISMSRFLPAAGPASIDDVVRSINSGIEPPSPVAPIVPAYPTALRDAGISGAAEIEFVVDTDGRVPADSIHVLFASRDEFSAQAREAISRARFHPGHVDGRPAAMRVRQRFTFESSDRSGNR